jgi:hypothetical protein
MWICMFRSRFLSKVSLFIKFRAGYRSSHIFEAAPISNINGAIHTANDVISRLDLPRALELVKVALGNTIELSSS